MAKETTSHGIDYLARTTGFIPEKKMYLIACKGQETEPNYFRALSEIWKIPITIKILEVKKDPLNVVKTAKEHNEKYPNSYNEAWAVFDRDSWEPKTIRSALDLAKKENIKVASSNEAFELWFILHYDAIISGLSRTTYEERLTTQMGMKYKKNNPNMFGFLRDKLPKAIQHAVNLASEMELEMYDHKFIMANPYTGVHLIIKSMLPKN